MRLKVKFRPRSNDEKIIVPIHYQSLLQGIIYHSLEEVPSFQTFLHDRGFLSGKRAFKLFTFSRLFGHAYYDRRTRRLIFHDEVIWHVGSVLPQLVHALGDALLLSNGVQIGHQMAAVDSVSFERPPEFTNRTLSIRMLSPITIYTTIKKSDGTQFTHFFRPGDEAFRQLLRKNCLRKYQAYYGEPYQDDIDFRPLRVFKGDKVVTAYRETIINAWNGTYLLSAGRKMLDFLYAGGLGAKNSQGFGMFAMNDEGGEMNADGIRH